jgi:hypothetical protein
MKGFLVQMAGHESASDSRPQSVWDFNDAFAQSDEGAIPWLWVDDGTAGEAAEGRHHQSVAAQQEAGETQESARTIAEFHQRMPVACEMKPAIG